MSLAYSFGCPRVKADGEILAPHGKAERHRRPPPLAFDGCLRRLPHAQDDKAPVAAENPDKTAEKHGKNTCVNDDDPVSCEGSFLIECRCFRQLFLPVRGRTEPAGNLAEAPRFRGEAGAAATRPFTSAGVLAVRPFSAVRVRIRRTVQAMRLTVKRMRRK